MQNFITFLSFVDWLIPFFTWDVFREIFLKEKHINSYNCQYQIISSTFDYARKFTEDMYHSSFFVCRSTNHGSDLRTLETGWCRINIFINHRQRNDLLINDWILRRLHGGFLLCWQRNGITSVSRTFNENNNSLNSSRHSNGGIMELVGMVVP